MTDKLDNLSFAQILDAAMMNVQSGAPVSIAQIVISLIISLVCCAWIAILYRLAYQGILYQKSFALTLVLGGVITTSIIMVISGNLILSLGMVGALSIVRFRSAIKDPLDIMFLFWVISIGIANGVGYFKVSLTGTVVISAIFYVMTRLTAPTNHKVLVVRFSSGAEAGILGSINQHSRFNKIRSKTINNGTVELITEVRTREDSPLLSRISELDGVLDCSLLSYSGNAID